MNFSAGTPKFCARMSGGVCASQSDTISVLNSPAAPLSKASTNSPPLSPSPCSECGRPGGKYQMSPAATSATSARPRVSMVVMRTSPLTMIAHSACWCQCSSRTPPGPRRMFTPAMSFDTGKALVVTSRAQPPAWMRLCAMLNEAHGIGMPPTSVGGGLLNEGSTSRSCGFCGPGSAIAIGVELIAPCAGVSGLPNSAALAAAAAPSATARAGGRADQYTATFQIGHVLFS